MIITALKLTNFRSYPQADFQLSQQTVLLGKNGAGKSNLIEAVYLVAVGKSFRADRDFEMVQRDKEFALIEGQVGETNLKVTITDRKKFEVNGVPRRMVDFVGNLKAVLFSPTDMELMTASPGSRRRYLDFVLSQTDREYRRSLVSYEKGVRQRNRLLELIRDGAAQRSQLFFWDKLLIKNGDYLTQKRGDYLASLASDKYAAVYDKSIISEMRLSQYEREEVAAATTLVGPHRDDFAIHQNGNDISKYGSRGEQRMAMLWLKQGEILRLSEGELPLLLLDDIFSELDHQHREEVLQIVAVHQLAGGQTILTSADEHLLPTFPNSQLIRLS